MDGEPLQVTEGNRSSGKTPWYIAQGRIKESSSFINHT